MPCIWGISLGVVCIKGGVQSEPYTWGISLGVVCV